MQVLAPLTIISIMLYGSVSGKGNRKIILGFVLMFFTVVAFSFQPNSGADLIREFEKLRNIQKYGWDYIKELTSNISGDYYSSTFQGIPVAAIYYYLIAQLPVLNFLPAISIFIDYLLEFKLLQKLSDKFELGDNDCLVLFISILCFRETYMMMSGIRNYLAFTIIGYALYYDLIEKRHKLFCWVAYVLAALMHQSGWIILAIRISLLIPWKRIKNILPVVGLLWGSFLSVIVTVFDRFSYIPIINSLYVKTYNFTSSTSTYSSLSTMSTTYMWYMISNIGMIIFVIYCLNYWRRGSKNISENDIVQESGIKFYGGTIYIYRNKEQIDIASTCISFWDDIFYFTLLALCVMIGSLPYRIIFSRVGIMLRVVSVMPAAIVLWDMNKKELWQSKRNAELLLLFASAFKFVIMMIFINRSMDFNLFGLFT